MTGLPSDGTVYLADGATPVVNGETLTTTQLTGLTFKPTANLFGQSSTFTYSVTDAANNTANGSATLAIQNQSNPGQPTTVTMSPSGLHGATLSGGGIDTLQIQGAGTADLSGVSAFPKIVLDPNGNAVTLGTGNFAGVGTILVVAPGPGSTVDASADRSGKTLLFSATGNGQRFVGGFETVGVYVAAMSVGSDTLQGGSGTNFLNLAGGGNADLSNATGFEFVILDPN
ncbi:MAG: hypothetical protein JO038_06270, partial [Alphaproteobacteria bacterium]|nr:hypothetical protein [Alphaproteobacteria bacterium]